MERKWLFYNAAETKPLLHLWRLARRRKVVLRRMAAAAVDSLAKAVQLADNSRLGSCYFACSRRIGKKRLRRSILRKPVYGN